MQTPRVILVATVGVLLAMSGGVNGYPFGGIGGVVNGFIDGTQKVVNGVVDGAQQVVGGALNATGTAVGGVLNATGTAVGGALNATGTTVSNVVADTTNFLNNTAGNITQGVGNVVDGVVGGVTSLLSPVIGRAINDTQVLASWLSNSFQQLNSTVTNQLSNLSASLTNEARSSLSALGGIFQNLKTKGEQLIGNATTIVDNAVKAINNTLAAARDDLTRRGLNAAKCLSNATTAANTAASGLVADKMAFLQGSGNVVLAAVQNATNAITKILSCDSGSCVNDLFVETGVVLKTSADAIDQQAAVSSAFRNSVQNTLSDTIAKIQGAAANCTA